MKIIYNPTDGAPIKTFIHNGEKLEPHYPDGYETPTGEISNGLLQYDDFAAVEILETYLFLKQLTVEEAKKIVDRPPEPKYKCDFPSCDFSTHTKIALSGHKKSHAKDIKEAGIPAIDIDIIPIAGRRKVNPLAEKGIMSNNRVDTSDILNGRDKDGVEWYGAGVEVENNSQNFGAIRQAGRGHFVG